MTEFDKESFYYTLDKSTVDKDVIKHQMAKGGYFYNEIIYSFGDFRVVFTKYTPESKNTPLGHVCIYGKKRINRPLASWNQTRMRDNYAYDMYIAAKNKYDGKPYTNPYKQHNPNVFSQILNENSEMIFPQNVPTNARADIIRRMQVMFMKNIEQYNGK